MAIASVLAIAPDGARIVGIRVVIVRLPSSPAELRPLSTSDLQRWRACARQFWLHRHGPAGSAPAPSPDAPADDALAARMVDEPGSRAALRASFPGLISLDDGCAAQDHALAIERTRAALADHDRHDESWALEGAHLVSTDGIEVRIDLITRGAHGFRLFKRRHATAGTEADVDAVALWLHVAAHAGWRIQSAGLLLIDTSFVYPGHGCYAGLYREVDLTPVLGTRPVKAWLQDMWRCDQAELPAVPLGAPCTAQVPCPQLSHCGLPDADTRLSPSAASLDILGRDLAAELRAEGHFSLLDLPLDRLSSPRHRRMALAVRTGQAVVEPGAVAALSLVPGPRRWLRVETIGFALPPWAGTHPYQALPFQWSCDLDAGDGRIVHSSHIAPAGPDPRRGFALSLVRGLGNSGPLLAYNAGFERNRIRELAARFEDLSEPLLALLPRIVDLFALMRDHAYHPAMAGAWSARSVFAAFAPQAGAHRFEVDGHGSPLQAYAASLQPGVSAAQTERWLEALQAHGRRHCTALRTLTQVLLDAT